MGGRGRKGGREGKEGMRKKERGGRGKGKGGKGWEGSLGLRGEGKRNRENLGGQPPQMFFS